MPDSADRRPAREGRAATAPSRTSSDRGRPGNSGAPQRGRSDRPANPSRQSGDGRVAKGPRVGGQPPARPRRSAGAETGAGRPAKAAGARKPAANNAGGRSASTTGARPAYSAAGRPTSSAAGKPGRTDPRGESRPPRGAAPRSADSRSSDARGSDAPGSDPRGSGRAGATGRSRTPDRSSRPDSRGGPSPRTGPSTGTGPRSAAAHSFVGCTAAGCAA